MLVVYPSVDFDSFIYLDDANKFIAKNSVFNKQWTELSDENKEVFLRIATKRILDVIDTNLLTGDTDICLVNATASMAVRDLVFNISSGVNDNKGAIIKEKVEGIEVQYYHGNRTSINALDKNPYKDVVNCLNSFGAKLSAGYSNQLKIERC